MGYKGGFDYLIYSKPEYNANQMRQIRYGLISNLDVSIYANHKFIEQQMNEIRTGLEHSIM